MLRKMSSSFYADSLSVGKIFIGSVWILWLKWKLQLHGFVTMLTLLHTLFLWAWCRGEVMHAARWCKRYIFRLEQRGCESELGKVTSLPVCLWHNPRVYNLFIPDRHSALCRAPHTVPFTSGSSERERTLVKIQSIKSVLWGKWLKISEVEQNNKRLPSDFTTSFCALIAPKMYLSYNFYTHLTCGLIHITTVHKHT